MREHITQRLVELQAEHAKGEQVLADMQQQQAQLEQTLLRISGAIQVLDELLTQPPAGEMDGEHGGDN